MILDKHIYVLGIHTRLSHLASLLEDAIGTAKTLRFHIYGQLEGPLLGVPLAILTQLLLVPPLADSQNIYRLFFLV